MLSKIRNMKPGYKELFSIIVIAIALIVDPLILDVLFGKDSLDQWLGNIDIKLIIMAFFMSYLIVQFMKVIRENKRKE